MKMKTKILTLAILLFAIAGSALHMPYMAQAKIGSHGEMLIASSEMGSEDSSSSNSIMPCCINTDDAQSRNVSILPETAVKLLKMQAVSFNIAASGEIQKLVQFLNTIYFHPPPDPEGLGSVIRIE